MCIYLFDFMDRGYSKSEVSTQIKRAKDITRRTTLTKKDKQQLTRIPLVLTYNPSLPPVMNAIKKHWHILQSDSALRETFKDPPMTAYRRNLNLGDILNSKNIANNEVIRPSSVNHRGTCKPCYSNRKNKCCQQVKTTHSFKSAQTNKTYKIYHDLTCKSGWILYLLECRLCPKIQYVGKSEPPANIRINKHRDDCKISTTIDIDQHFRLPGHNFNQHAVFTFIEQLKTFNKEKQEKRAILEKREDFWIMELKTLKPKGMNAILNHQHHYTGILRVE